MLERARTLLANGESVVLDAVLVRRRPTDPSGRGGRTESSDLTAFACSAPSAVLTERLARRRPEQAHGSDATAEVMRSMRDRFVSWPEASVIDSTRTTEACLDGMRAVLAQA